MSSSAPPRNSVTLRRVAQETGVHPSTVSRALDPAKRHLVAEDVADRIVSAARQLGYRPDPVAASLRTRRSRLVGVLVPDITNPVFSPIVSGISEILGPDGYSIIVADAGADPLRQRTLVDELITRRVDGLVLATASRDDPVIVHCLAEQVPLVLVNRTDASGRTCAVVSDDVAGMRLAVDHLISLGHRRIGHIAGPQAFSTGHLRRVGFETAMRANGLPIDSSAIVETAVFARDEGERASTQLLDTHPDLTAIAAGNDLLAFGAYGTLAARGMRCPHDVSVVGYNDMPFADMVAPPLTTVRFGPREMGRTAGRLMIATIGGEADAHGVTVTPSLVIRSSTAAPRA